MSRPKRVETEKGPSHTAFSLEKREGGWSMIKVIYRDNQIEEIIKTEPNLKIIAIAEFKKAAFQYWSSIG